MTYALLITYFEYIIRIFKLYFSVIIEKLLKMSNMNVHYVPSLLTNRVIIECLKKHSTQREHLSYERKRKWHIWTIIYYITMMASQWLSWIKNVCFQTTQVWLLIFPFDENCCVCLLVFLRSAMEGPAH